MDQYLLNHTALEPIWRALDAIGDVEEGKDLLNKTISQTIDKNEIKDFLTNKTLNARIEQG